SRWRGVLRLALWLGPLSRGPWESPGPLSTTTSDPQGPVGCSAGVPATSKSDPSFLSQPIGHTPLSARPDRAPVGPERLVRLPRLARAHAVGAARQPGYYLLLSIVDAVGAGRSSV